LHLEEIFEYRSLAALRGRNQDRFITKLRGGQSHCRSFTLPHFPLRLAFRFVAATKAARFQKKPPSNLLFG
jgi:hypothetical protein